MKTKYIIALAAGAFALVGCQREELAEPGVLPGKDGVVTFAPSVSGIDSEFKSGVSESGKQSLTLTSKDGSYSLPMSCSASAFEGGALTKATLINETGGITAAKFAEAIDGTFWVAAWDKPTSGDPAHIIPDKTISGYTTADGKYQKVMYRTQDVTGASLATPYWMTMQPMPSTITVVSKDQPADDEYIWKKSEKKTFYAYANVPSDATVALIEKAGGQTMTCTGIPGTDVLMGYYQGEGKTGTGDAAKPTGTASIQFHHPLAAVKVKTGTLAEGVTISSVAIEKVYGKGALMVKQEEDTFTWTRGDEAEFKDENLVESIALTCDGEAEFVIPQTVPSKARIRVTLKEDGVPFNVYSPLSGITWKADTVYTYTIGYNPQPEELLPGKFSISADKYVQFSRGNLQATYHSSSSSYSWAFAANQYDCVGFASGSGNTTIKDDGSNEDGAVVDLFGWTAAGKYSDGMKQYGINKSTSNSDYRVTGDASDECCNWGEAIDGSGSLWYILSGNNGEWDYLLFDRPNAAQKWGMATITTSVSVKGAVILPDDWTLPEGCSFTAGKTSSYYKANEYDSDTWAKMEQAGAVFLPAAEFREGIIRGETGAVDLCGYYWSQTAASSNNVYRMNFSRSGFTATNSQIPYRGHSVRLVQRFPKPEIEPEFVDLGLPSGLMWANVNLGAVAETGPGSIGNYYFWGETEPWFKTQYVSSTSILITEWLEGHRPTSTDNVTTNVYQLYANMYDQSKSGKDGYIASNLTGEYAKYDAVIAKGWEGRMPTSTEWEELWTKTTMTRSVTVDGITCYKFANKNDSNKYILLPTAGRYDKSYSYVGGSDHIYAIGSENQYWSSTSCSDKTKSFCFSGRSKAETNYEYERYLVAMPIRPVKDAD